MKAPSGIHATVTHRARRGLRAAYFVFLFVGSAAVAYAVYQWFEAHWYQRTTASEFETGMTIAPPVSLPVEPPIAVGDVIGEIHVPRLGLKATVIQGDSESVLRHAVGHLPDTALPGHGGNVALAAHRDGLFRPLRNVRRGDLIVLQSRNGEIEYEVEWTAVVAPGDTQVIQPTREPALTLVTCFPFYFVGSAPKRFIVRAREVPKQETQNRRAETSVLQSDN